MNCATCTHWKLETTWLKDCGMAPCGLGAIYTVLGPKQSCARYSALEQPLLASRRVWFERLTEKHNKGTV